MFGNIIAADIGSAFTRLAAAKGLSQNETRAALDPGNSRRVLAFGEDAGRVLNASEAYPVRGGVSDIPLTALMLRRFSLGLTKRRTLFGMSLLAALPSCAVSKDREAILEVGREAGFRRVGTADCLLAGAAGAGLDLNRPTAQMIVDIGRETVKTLVFVRGGIIAESVERFGSAAYDRRITAYFAEEQGVLLTSAAAERLKMSLDKPVLRVSGRDASSGLPAAREIASSIIRREAAPAAQRLATALASAINALPPEPAGDLLENGVTLIGGGAKRFGLAEELEEALCVPVSVAQNPESAVILGLSQYIRRECPADLEAMTGNG
jgi:rod shape-determining protein MreB